MGEALAYAAGDAQLALQAQLAYEDTREFAAGQSARRFFWGEIQ